MLENGIIIDPDNIKTVYSESHTDKENRIDMMWRANSYIFLKHLNYISLMIVTFFLVIIPLLSSSIPGFVADERSSAVTEIWGPIGRFLGQVLSYTSDYLPSYASYWIETGLRNLQNDPITATIFLAAVGALFLLRTWAEDKLGVISEAGWWHTKGFPPATRFTTPPGIFERNANRFRTSALGKGLAWLWLGYLLPSGFALICLFVFAGAVYRALWYYPLTMDGVCNLPRATEAFGQNASVATLTELRTLREGTITFDTSIPCFNTGIELESGSHYRVVVTVTKPWLDQTIPANIKGFDSFWDKLKLIPFVPARRHPSLPWFALTGEIGADSGDIFPLNRSTFDFIPPTTGTLYLYVNDAVAVPVCPLWLCRIHLATWLWDRYYRNNKGTTTVEIEKVRQ